MALPFRVYVVADPAAVADARTLRDEVVLLAARAKSEIAVYWRAPTADDLPGLPDDLRAFRTPLFVKESDLDAWPRLRGDGGAAGVHLKSFARTSAADVRARFARPVWIARAAHSTDDAARAKSEGADLVVFGHVFETPSKSGLPPRGLDGLRAACEAAAPVPVFALGGMRPDRIAVVRASGAWGVATMRGLLGARDARE